MNDLDHWWIMLPLAIVVFLASAFFEERRKKRRVERERLQRWKAGWLEAIKKAEREGGSAVRSRFGAIVLTPEDAAPPVRVSQDVMSGRGLPPLGDEVKKVGVSKTPEPFVPFEQLHPECVFRARTHVGTWSHVATGKLYIVTDVVRMKSGGGGGWEWGVFYFPTNEPNYIGFVRELSEFKKRFAPVSLAAERGKS